MGQVWPPSLSTLPPSPPSPEERRRAPHDGPLFPDSARQRGDGDFGPIVGVAALMTGHRWRFADVASAPAVSQRWMTCHQQHEARKSLPHPPLGPEMMSDWRLAGDLAAGAGRRRSSLPRQATLQGPGALTRWCPDLFTRAVSALSPIPPTLSPPPPPLYPPEGGPAEGVAILGAPPAASVLLVYYGLKAEPITRRSSQALTVLAPALQEMPGI